jgi:hypothetical protein
MGNLYHDLPDVVAVDNVDGLTIPRARTLFGAIQRQRDYSLIQLLRHPVEGAPTIEYLIVEVVCDGVPAKNTVGIHYREHLALCVHGDPKRLIEVLALRQDFPVLMHQNLGMPGAPASLCLYFEPASVTMRTWTPAAFLRRIQWWLEKSARGELHPADQPVERLFFASIYELVLPWNWAELGKNPAFRFALIQQSEHPNRGFTCFLEAIPKDMPKVKGIAHVELTLPAVIHGIIEHAPVTLGQLADMLKRRKVDLIEALCVAIQDRVDGNGVDVSTSDNYAVILLHLPVCRTTDAEPDTVLHYAFISLASVFELGKAIGSLFVLDKKYYKDVIPQQTTAWRDQPIFPMDVLMRNDGAAARRQSGITEEGPASVLIGAGSLGSALLNLWGRSGWGRWTVIDKDHIKPHNLSRHSAYMQHIGAPKAAVVAELHTAAMGRATEIVPLVADATDLTQESVTNTLSAATLVVDASTTLEYPRIASTVDALPRHVSVFVAPNGRSAVLLAEDAGRTQRLRTLEAQYYRALIQEDWGKTHLSGHANTFWSGAGCRDISVVMPYSRILGHASTFAEQIQCVVAHENALIRIWQRDPVLGSVEVHDVAIFPEHRFTFGELDLFIDEGVKQQLQVLRQRALPNETGGVLLGYHDFNINAVVIVAGLPAPPDSKAGPDFFKRGIAGLPEKVNDASTRTAGMVGYVGEWHSHPPGHSALPSQQDWVQFLHVAFDMNHDDMPAIQLIIGEREMSVTKSGNQWN